jgi:PST family polysaccharide transporter
MSLRQKAVQGVLWAGIQNWGSGLITMVVIVILARLLDSSAWGLIAWATVFVEFLGIVQRQGFGQVLIQRKDLEPGHLNAAFWSSAIAGLVFSSSMFLSADLIASMLDVAELGSVLRWFSIVVLIQAIVTIPLAILRRNLSFRSLAVRALAAAAIGGVVGITMALRGYGVWSLVGQQIATIVASAVALWFAARWCPTLQVSKKHFKDLFGFGIYTMARGVVIFLNRRAADFIIGITLGPEPLGFYYIGRRLISTMNRLLTESISSVALPTFSRLQHDYGQMRQALLTATRLASLLGFPAFLGVAVLAPELVTGLFGDQWAPSAPVMRILAIASLVQCVAFFNNPLIVACGKPSWVLSTTILNAVIGIALYSLAAQVGIVAVAFAHALRNLVCVPLPLVLVKKLIALDIETYLRGYMAPFGASVAMMAAVWMVKWLLPDSMSVGTVLVVAVFAGIGVYWLSMRLIAPDRLQQARENVRLALGSKGT